MHSNSTQPRLLAAIFWGGFICGVLDITAAFVVYGFFGARPIRLLQGIAAGLLGPKSFEGGLTTAALGLVCHFIVAFSAAMAFVLASRQLRFLLDHTLLSGVLYGPVVYFFMNRVVVPLSAVRPRPFSFKMMLIGLAIHVFCVGLPISLATRRWAHH